MRFFDYIDTIEKPTIENIRVIYKAVNEKYDVVFVLGVVGFCLFYFCFLFVSVVVDFNSIKVQLELSTCYISHQTQQISIP